MRMYVMNSWLEWCWDVQVSDNSSRTAAVIDGSRLLLTPLAHVVTPPPMAAKTITLTNAINSVSFCSRPFDGIISFAASLYRSIVPSLFESHIYLCYLNRWRVCNIW
jgi:hypothetical protein